MNEIIAFVLVTILAVISPGADFALVTRNSYLFGRKLGLLTACGIACGVWFHISCSLIALSFLQSNIPSLLKIIQYIGATYLIYIGYKTFTQERVSFNAENISISAFQAFKQGVLTNSLNPKTTLFVISLFSQIMRSESNVLHLLSFGVFISFSHLVWFLMIAYFCSAPTIRNQILAKQVVINRIIGSILSGLGLSLFFSNL